MTIDVLESELNDEEVVGLNSFALLHGAEVQDVVATQRSVDPVSRTTEKLCGLVGWKAGLTRERNDQG